MIAWMAYSIAISALLGLAALAGERALRGREKPGRWPWAAALAGGILVPMLARLRALAAASESVGEPTSGAVATAFEPLGMPFEAVATASSTSGVSIDAIAAGSWILASGLLLVSVALAMKRLQVGRAGWVATRVGRTRVLVADDVGPAALPGGRIRVVVPRWALDFEARMLALLLAHEEEHVSARDPELAAAALAVAIVLPWNPAVWWKFARLRDAIEMDCDARVLRKSDGSAAYGRLLLEVGRRRANAGPLALALRENASGLERRLRAVLDGTPRRSAPRAFALVVAAVALATLAVCTPDATAPNALSDAPVATAAWQVAPRLVNLAEVRAMGLFREQAEYARDGDVTVDVLVLLGDDGTPLLTRDPPGTDAAQPGKALAKVIALQLRFEPAYRDGQPVRSAFRLPLTFSADGPMQVGTPRAIEPDSELDEILAQSHDRMRQRPVIQGSDPGPFAEPEHTPFDEAPILTNRKEVVERLALAVERFREDIGDVKTARVWLYINERGEVPQVRGAASSGSGRMDAVALGVASEMRFEPARSNGEPIAVWISLPITFMTR